MRRKRSKYGNVRTAGFHSRKEKLRHDELMIMQKAGAIEDLKCQVPFVLTTADPYGKIIPVTYPETNRKAKIIIDFEYLEVSPEGRKTRVFEDVKGFDTPIGRLKRALFTSSTGHRIKIT